MSYIYTGRSNKNPRAETSQNHNVYYVILVTDMTFTYDSVAAVAAEPDHFLAISITFPMKETHVFATRKRDLN